MMSMIMVVLAVFVSMLQLQPAHLAQGGDTGWLRGEHELHQVLFAHQPIPSNRIHRTEQQVEAVVAVCRYQHVKYAYTEHRRLDYPLYIQYT